MFSDTFTRLASLPQTATEDKEENSRFEETVINFPLAFKFVTEANKLFCFEKF